jgi:hypothetical protein
MRKCLLFFIVFIFLFLMQACFDDGGGNPSPTPAPLEKIELDVPHHFQRYDYTCLAVGSWMYVENRGNIAGFKKYLPDDPEVVFYNFLYDYYSLSINVDSIYYYGLNYLVYDYTWTFDDQYTVMYYNYEENNDQMVSIQTYLIDIGEPSIAVIVTDEGFLHAVVVVGYWRDSETKEPVIIIVHDPGVGPYREHTISEWKAKTAIHMGLDLYMWFFVAKEDIFKKASCDASYQSYKEIKE